MATEIKAPGGEVSELRFEDQLLAFKVRLTQCGPMAALELLNDRTRYRSTALYRISHENLHLLHVFDRFDQNRAYLLAKRSASRCSRENYRRRRRLREVGLSTGRSPEAARRIDHVVLWLGTRPFGRRSLWAPVPL